MSQIIINEMSYHYADFYNPIFNKITLLLDTDWKTGLIGRNGRGKTTLLKLLCQELEPTAGTISVPVPVSYFPYHYCGEYKNTMDVIKEMTGGIRTLELAMETALSQNQTDKYLELLEQYQSIDGYSVESNIYREAEHMRLDSRLLEQDFDTLSGGERTRMIILALFLRREGYVLLDEPTNHLDHAGKQALTEYLKKKKGFLVVSHDNHFLNEVTDHILSINKTNLTLEQGNYATWKQNVLQKEKYELRTRQRLEQEIHQLSRQAVESRKWSDTGNTQKYPFASNARTNGTRAYMRQAKRAENQVLKNIEEKKRLLQNLEQAEELAILQERLDTDDYMLKAEGISFSYEENRPLFHNFSIRIVQGERIWLRGRNGAGKSTLLRLLCGTIPCAQVQYAGNLKIATAFQEPKWTQGNIQTKFQQELTEINNCFQQQQPDINNCFQQQPEISNCFRQEFPERKTMPDDAARRYEKFLELCRLFDLPEDFTLRPIETLSSGELKKIDIARTLSMENQLLFLDEPLNYMDTLFREQLTKALCDSDVTAIFVEHDESFGNAVATRVIDLDTIIPPVAACQEHM